MKHLPPHNAISPAYFELTRELGPKAFRFLVEAITYADPIGVFPVSDSPDAEAAVFILDPAVRGEDRPKLAHAFVWDNKPMIAIGHWHMIDKVSRDNTFRFGPWSREDIPLLPPDFAYAAPAPLRPVFVTKTPYAELISAFKAICVPKGFTNPRGLTKGAKAGIKEAWQIGPKDLEWWREYFEAVVSIKHDLEWDRARCIAQVMSMRVRELLKEKERCEQLGDSWPSAG